MWQIIGIFGVFGAIGAGYTIEGGSFAVVIEALGPELLMILGSGAATVMVANEIGTVKAVAVGLKKIATGPRWKKTDYIDALCLVFLLVRVAKQEGNAALEQHIENPASSSIFSRYPRLLADHHLVAFLADGFRTVTMNFSDAHKIGEMMDAEIDARELEEMRAPKALSTMADALPALGIVAAVLGVIKAMGAINESPDVLGHMIGAALVGTFLGVFLSYGMIGPMAGRMKAVLQEESTIFAMVRQVVTSYLEGLGPQLAVEVGRKSVPTRFQPSFLELDEILSETARTMRGQ